MAEYAPQAIRDMFTRIQASIPQAILAGIVGDSAHTYGYHRARNVVSSSDYSNQLSVDKQGDGWAASALDISWASAQPQYDVSRRLMNAKTDPRMKVMRSFFGSMDGKNVCGWDYQGGYSVTSDSSHLWHVHLSVCRKWANDTAALAAVADVCTGKSGTVPPDDIHTYGGEEDMLLQRQSDKLGVYIGGGKAVWVRNGNDLTAMKNGGVPQALVSDAFFGAIIDAYGGAKG